jgi:hypothetical protein
MSRERKLENNGVRITGAEQPSLMAHQAKPPA